MLKHINYSWRRVAYEELLRVLMEPSFHEVNKDLEALMRENNQLNNVDPTARTSFFYNNESFLFSPIFTTSKKQRDNLKYVDLHYSLEPRIDELIEERTRLNKAMDDLQYFFRKIFNLAQTQQDAITLLPANVLSKMKNKIDAIGNITLSLEQINNFKEENKRYYEVLNEQLLTNLIIK